VFPVELNVSLFRHVDRFAFLKALASAARTSLSFAVSAYSALVVPKQRFQQVRVTSLAIISGIKNELTPLASTMIYHRRAA